MRRFWDKVDKQDCWEWKAALRGGKGYGAFWYEGRHHRAHRVAWMLKHGEFPPDDMLVLHKCDNPKCVNPDHLFLGTQQDNVDDMVKKGRGRNQWDGSVRTKVLEMKTQGKTGYQIAKEIGADTSYVYAILREGC